MKFPVQVNPLQWTEFEESDRDAALLPAFTYAVMAMHLVVRP